VIGAIKSRAKNPDVERIACCCYHRDRTRMSPFAHDGVVNLGWSRGDTAIARRHATAAAADQRLKAPQRPARSDTERPSPPSRSQIRRVRPRASPTLTLLGPQTHPRFGVAILTRERRHAEGAVTTRIVAPWSSALDDAPSIRIAWVSIA